MTRTARLYPIPKIVKRGKKFRLRWYANNSHYEISLGNSDKTCAKTIRSELEAAFAKKTDVPDEIRNEPSLKNYLNSLVPINANIPDSDLITKYLKHLQSTCSSQWPKRVKYFLNKAESHIGSLKLATPLQIMEFLDVTAENISPASRNRAQISLSGFYKFLRTAKIVGKKFNPMENIKQIREERPMDGIVIWEENELKELLQAADSRQDGIAIWIAILAGLRRSEIAQLLWNDISPAYILVRKSKNGEKRQIPLSAALAKKLENVPHASPRVVPWPSALTGWQTAARRLVELHLPNRLPEIHQNHPEKFGWNPFRHTFASRHAQKGLSLDIIAAWMGNSPKVCKEHYARYIPKNKRDSRIDAADPAF